jgi:20S proteasome subunit beta 2
MAEVTSRSQRLAESEELQGGFNFELYRRNAALVSEKRVAPPCAFKTGTTIVGMKFKDGVVLGADTRATGGDEIVDKNCAKIHYMAPNMYCCGAGTAADTEKVTQMIASQLELLRLNTDSQSRCATAHTLLKRLLFRYHGNVGAALILGGVDVTGPHLFNIHPHGSSWELPYDTMGSGQLAAMSVFETKWREDLNEEDAVQVVKEAVLAGVFNDLGSGSNVDVTIIRKTGEVVKIRGLERPNEVAELRSRYTRPTKLAVTRGATIVIHEEFRPHTKRATPLIASAGADETKMDVV